MNTSSLAEKEHTSSSLNSNTTDEKIKNTQTEELVIGICYPIGSDSTFVINAIKARLEKYHYDVEIIKISDYIKEFYEKDINLISGKTESYSELMHKINGGDSLRQTYNDYSILAELAINKIRVSRGESDITKIKSRRKCFIIDSLKNFEELKLLRSIYGDIFYLFSIFSPEKERKENLLSKGLSQPESDELIETDEYENNKHGQNVRNTFIDGDFFVRISNNTKNKIETKIERYIHLIFETEIITPNSDETAMYHARSVAGNSACLSRQVGATITNKDGVVIARGWNDVPKAGGNLYQESDEKSNRCFEKGFCSNVTHRNKIFEEIATEIEKIVGEKKTIGLSTKKSDKTLKILDVLKKSKFKNIIEYSRSIHAEMHAIIIGSQMTSNKMINGNLYCTTYPCHNCARHIILAGIKNIYYIEPYKKSLGMELHGDALTEDENNQDKVRILAYDGVAPRRYLEFFSMKLDRKSKDGTLLDREIKTALPKKRVSLQALPMLETQAIKVINESGILKKRRT